VLDFAAGLLNGPDSVGHITSGGSESIFVAMKAARDWARATALLRGDLQVTWWSSGERFDGPTGFVRAQARYPDGWGIQLIEVSPLQDGRVVSVVRVDHPPQCFFATSFFHLEDGLIFAIDEYWATAEEPPAWRTAAGLTDWQRMNPADDPRAHRP
jgi:hypothetical protein